MVLATNAEQSAQHTVLIIEANIDSAMNRPLEVIVLPETPGNTPMDTSRREVACVKTLASQRVDVGEDIGQAVNSMQPVGESA